MIARTSNTSNDGALSLTARAERTLTDLGEAYAGAKGLKLSTIGIYACKDARFFAKIGSGSLTTQRYDKMLDWLSANWPDDLPWPDKYVKSRQGRPMPPNSGGEHHHGKDEGKQKQAKGAAAGRTKRGAAEKREGARK